MKTLLIDADMLLFRTMAAWEIEANLGDEVWVRWAELNTVRDEFWRTIESGWRNGLALATSCAGPDPAHPQANRSGLQGQPRCFGQAHWLRSTEA